MHKLSRDGFMKNNREFQQLYQQYFSLVLRHINYLLGGNSLVAEDIAQETFIKLHSSPPVTEDNLPAWLMKVASNNVYNYLKSNKQRVERENRVSFTSRDREDNHLPEENFLHNQQVLAVKEVLELLPERDRICLLLKYSGFSYSEISQVIGVEKSSVGTILARAQKKFKNKFVQRNGGTVDVL